MALILFIYYSSAIAPTGQLPAHAPHEMHVSPSITNWPSPSEIALTGQPAAHVPHEMHESLITYAILISSFTNVLTRSKLTAPYNSEVYYSM